jgi:hypothetical protein
MENMNHMIDPVGKTGVVSKVLLSLKTLFTQAL